MESLDFGSSFPAGCHYIAVPINFLISAHFLGMVQQHATKVSYVELMHCIAFLHKMIIILMRPCAAITHIVEQESNINMNKDM